MILLFSESSSDYSRYIYPYVIWAVPEAGETPAELFAQGFLPSSPKLDRFYLCRNIRVDLRRFTPSSENRRVLRKGEGIDVALIPRAQFDYSPARRQAWKAFADERFGPDVMSLDRLDALMSNPVISHLFHFTDRAAGREVGTALLFLQEPEVVFYYYAFYDLRYFRRNLGMFMMTKAVEWFCQRGLAYAHLGTCYSERALYKTQFAGVQFFNGFRWSDNLDELKFMLQRDRDQTPQHLLNLAEFREPFYGETMQHLAAAGHFRLQCPPRGNPAEA